MTAMNWQGTIIVVGIVCGTILSATGTSGAWFPWMIAALLLFFGG